MAGIDDLVRQIADETLRKQIAAEVAALKKGKRFGLVFEQHLPEIVELPGLPIRPGVRVRKMSAADAGAFWVTANAGTSRVKVRPEGENGRPNPEAPEESVVSSDLVV